MAGIIKVGCKLPAGIQLPALKGMQEGFAPPVLNGSYTHPSFDARSGIRDSLAFGTTDVDADYWAAFVKAFPTWPPLKRGMVFAFEKAADLKAKAKELEGEKTGFEGADPDAKGSGVKRANIK